jgi:hypothetical protein
MTGVNGRNNEIEYKNVGWIHLAQDRDRWQALVNTVVILHVPSKTVNFLTS